LLSRRGEVPQDDTLQGVAGCVAVAGKPSGSDRPFLFFQPKWRLAMDAQVKTEETVKTEKTELPSHIKRGLNELWDLRENIHELRKIQTAVG
jgi:hypothetical protein